MGSNIACCAAWLSLEHSCRVFKLSLGAEIGATWIENYSCSINRKSEQSQGCCKFRPISLINVFAKIANAIVRDRRILRDFEYLPNQNSAYRKHKFTRTCLNELLLHKTSENRKNACISDFFWLRKRLRKGWAKPAEMFYIYIDKLSTMRLVNIRIRDELSSQTSHIKFLGKTITTSFLCFSKKCTSATNTLRTVFGIRSGLHPKLNALYGD